MSFNPCAHASMQMATLKTAKALLEEVRVAARPGAEKDLAELKAFALEQVGGGNGGEEQGVCGCVRGMGGLGCVEEGGVRDKAIIELCGGGLAEVKSAACAASTEAYSLA